MRKPKWDTEAGRKMWLDGKTDEQIAMSLGTTARAVNLYKYRKWVPEKKGIQGIPPKLPEIAPKTQSRQRKTAEESLAEIQELERTYGDKLGGMPETAIEPAESPASCESAEISDTDTTKQEETKVNNCIIMGEKRIELTEEQVAKIVAALSADQTKLSDVPEGGTFKIGKYEFIVLEQTEDTAAVILKNPLPAIAFGEDNNRYDGSNVDQACCEFAEELISIIGSENVIPHTVDLTSNDGLKDYGQIERVVSLLTADQYRRYVLILDKEKLGDWWWLATPWSTPSHESDSCVLSVSPSGRINYNSYYDGDCGVRPFCILKSNIFVSK